MKKLPIASWFLIAASLAHGAAAQSAGSPPPRKPKAPTTSTPAPSQAAPAPAQTAPAPAQTIAPPPASAPAEAAAPSAPSPGSSPPKDALDPEGPEGAGEAPPPAGDFPPVLNPLPSAPPAEAQPVEAPPAEAPPAPPSLSAPRVIAVHEATPEDSSASVGSSPKSRPLSTVFNGSVRTYFDVNAVWNLDDKYQLFDKSDVNWRLGLSAGYDLLKFGEGWVVSPELGYSHENATGGPNAPQFSHKEITGEHFFAAFRGRTSLASWIEGFGRIQGGLAWTQVDLAASSGESDKFSIDDKAPEFQLGAGLQARTPDPEGSPPGESLSLGFMLEGGYQLAPALALKLERDAAAGQRFTVLTSNLGELSRSGPFVRFGAFARF